MTITLKHSAENCDCRLDTLAARWLLVWKIKRLPAVQQAGVRRSAATIAAAFTFSACLCLQSFPAFAVVNSADGAATQRSSVQSSSEAASKIEITPNGVTLAASQTQHFKVTDKNGKSVPVHWDVSGLTCSGSACGTVDDDGTYRAPQSLSRAFVVVLEGVLVSDPKHSVLTRIQVAPAFAAQVASPISSQSQPQVHAQAAPLASVRQAAVDLPAPRGPLVAYQGGKLTIDAVNTTLANVLARVADKTGAVIDVPPGTGLEPVVMHAGPGPANEVITQLLNGSHFNFIIVDSSQYPDEPIQVLLTEKHDANAPNVPAPVAIATAPPPAEVAPPEVAPGDSDNFVPVTVPTPAAAKPASGEQLSPDAIEQMMKDKANQIRENSPPQQQQ